VERFSGLTADSKGAISAHVAGNGPARAMQRRPQGAVDSASAGRNDGGVKDGSRGGGAGHARTFDASALLARPEEKADKSVNMPIPLTDPFPFLARNVAIGFLPILLAGCVSVQPLPPQSTVLNFPPLNTITEKELGDTLIDRGILKTYDCIITAEPIVVGLGFGTIKAEPGIFLAKGRTRSAVIYTGQQPIFYGGVLMSGYGTGGIMIPDNPITKPSIFVAINNEVRSGAIPPNVILEKSTSQQLLPGSFRQELIYNGRSGSSVKFLYREIKNSYLASPFTQEVTYDMADGNTIGFKGSRLKIIEATNINIKYEMLKTFE
jgi:hypothetical protein